MKKQITNLKCPGCDNGVIIMSFAVKNKQNVFEVKTCNKCGAFYGLKACEKLTAIGKTN